MGTAPPAVRVVCRSRCVPETTHREIHEPFSGLCQPTLAIVEGMSTEPCFRRRAMAALPLGAMGAASLAACGGEPDIVEPLDAEGGINLSDIPENATSLLDFGSQRPFAVVVRGSGDDIKVFSGYCTHNGCAVALEGDQLNCPCHGAQFDASTGEVLSGPTQENLPEIPVVIEDGVLRRA